MRGSAGSISQQNPATNEFDLIFFCGRIEISGRYGLPTSTTGPQTALKLCTTNTATDSQWYYFLSPLVLLLIEVIAGQTEC